MKKRHRKKLAVKDWDELARECEDFLRYHRAFTNAQKAAMVKMHEHFLVALQNSVIAGSIFFGKGR